MAIERRGAERKRRVGDRLFQAMFMAMDEGAISRNRSGDIVAVNPAAENILGLSAAALIGRSAADFVGTLNFIREDETPLPWELDPGTLALRTGRPQRNVLMGAHRPDGALVWMSFNAQPLLCDGESDPYGVVTTFRDVTEHKRAEDALSFVAQRGWMASKEKFFDALVKYLARTLGVNHVAVSTLAEASGIAETVALYTRGAVVANVRYTLRGAPCEKVMEGRFCFYPQGVQRIFPEDRLLAEIGAESYSGLPLWDSAGRPIGLIAVLDDKPLRDEAMVSQVLQIVAPRAAAELERERNDRTLRQSEREFRTLAENMPDGVVRYDRQARAKYMNSEIRANIAPEAVPVLGESLLETFAGSSTVPAEHLHHMIGRVIDTGAPVEMEFQLPNPRGEMRLRQVRYVAERDDTGEIVGALCIGRDITERKASERQLAQALEFTQGIIDAIPDLLLEMDRDGAFLNVWARTPELLAVHKEALLGKAASDVMAPEMAEVAQSALREADETGLSFGKVLRIEISQGERWFELSVSKKPGSDMPRHFIVLARDVTGRKRMEDDLRRRELEFRSLAESMPDNVVRYDRLARVQYFNPALKSSLAPEIMPALGLSAAESFPGADALMTYHRAIERVIATGTPAELEFQITNPRRQRRHHHVRVVAERDASGGIVGALAIGSDVTERKRAEEYEHFRSRTLESLSGGASLQDILEEIVRGVEQLDGDRICSILLLDRQGRHFCKGIAPSLPDSYNAALDGLAIGIGVGCCGTAAATGQRVIADDLSTHPYWAPYKELAASAGLGACWSEPIRASSGQVLGTFAVYHRQAHSPTPFDISLIEKCTHLASIAIERGRAQEALRASELEFRALAENLPDCLVRYDREGRRTYINPAMEQVAAVAPERMLGSSLRESNPTNMPMPEAYLRALEHTLATGERSEFEMQFSPSGGDTMIGLCFIVAERAADGRISGAIAVTRDITELKRNEAELERHRHHLEKLVAERTQALSIAKEAAEAATRAKSHFLAAASHDLRQPLQAIRLFNDALAMSGLNSRQKKIGNALSRSVSSLNELLNDLLDLSRLDAGSIEPQPVVIQAEDLLQAIAHEFDAVCQEKDLRLKLVCPQRGAAMFCDANLLLTLLRNLVSNAVKYTRSGGVLVGIRRREDRALIQVWDTGIGIPAEQKDSIFEEYFQIGNPERDRAKGVGLGLAIVRQLAKLLDVELHFRSREGKGSVFEVGVPLADGTHVPALLPRASGTPEMVAAPSRLAGKRIVVIEDDETAGEALKLALEMEGAEVVLFDAPEDALQSAAAMGADYYLSDYRLPGMNGLQLLDAIQKRTAAPIAAVVLTGNVSPEQLVVLRSSRWTVILKPVALDELLSALDPHMGLH